MLSPDMLLVASAGSPFLGFVPVLWEYLLLLLKVLSA